MRTGESLLRPAARSRRNVVSYKSRDEGEVSGEAVGGEHTVLMTATTTQRARGKAPYLVHAFWWR